MAWIAWLIALLRGASAERHSQAVESRKYFGAIMHRQEASFNAVVAGQQGMLDRQQAVIESLIRRVDSQEARSRECEEDRIRLHGEIENLKSSLMSKQDLLRQIRELRDEVCPSAECDKRTRLQKFDIGE